MGHEGGEIRVSVGIFHRDPPALTEHLNLGRVAEMPFWHKLHASPTIDPALETRRIRPRIENVLEVGVGLKPLKREVFGRG